MNKVCKTSFRVIPSSQSDSYVAMSPSTWTFLALALLNIRITSGARLATDEIEEGDCGYIKPDEVTTQEAGWVHGCYEWARGAARIPLVGCKPTVSSSPDRPLVVDVQPPPRATSSPFPAPPLRPAPLRLPPKAAGNPPGCSPDHTRALPTASSSPDRPLVVDVQPPPRATSS